MIALNYRIELYRVYIYIYSYDQILAKRDSTELSYWTVPSIYIYSYDKILAKRDSIELSYWTVLNIYSYDQILAKRDSTDLSYFFKHMDLTWVHNLFKYWATEMQGSRDFIRFHRAIVQLISLVFTLRFVRF